MNKRLVIVFFAAAGVAVLSGCVEKQVAVGGAAAARTELENAYYVLEFDSGNGAIRRIFDKAGKVDLAAVAGVAQSFRLELEGARGEQELIWGSAQKASAIDCDGDKVTFRWYGPLKDEKGNEHDMKVEFTAWLDGESIFLKMGLENGTGYRIAGVCYPAVGGLIDFGGHGGQAATGLVYSARNKPAPEPVKLDGTFKDVSLTYPGYLNMSFVDIYNSDAGRGIYISSREKIARQKEYYIMGMPYEKPRDILACVKHVPYTKPGEKFEGSEVVVRFHDGDWREGGKIYREWFIETFGLADIKQDWIRRQSFFEDIMYMLPEGNIDYRYDDIPRLAENAKKCGMEAIMVSGWHRCGHDNGYPYYEPDLRLGTYDDLKAAIERCHEIGVKVYFFVNFQPAMMGSDWYKKELYKYTEQGKDGKANWIAGWGMGTLWARMGHPKLMAFLDPSFDVLSDCLVEYFKKLAEIGADGVHVDKMFPTGLEFNPLMTRSVDTSTWEGAIRLAERVYRECKAINPDFAMSFECSWDRLFQYGCAIWWGGNMGFTRQVFPEMAETVSISSPYDYMGVNNAVREGLIVMVGMQNFTRSISWEPARGLGNYIREVKHIRDELAEAVFLGEVLKGAEVNFTRPVGSGVQYNTFRNCKTGKRACILTNKSMRDSKERLGGFEGNISGQVRIYTPFKEAVEAKIPVEIEVPAERIVFVMEL